MIFVDRTELFDSSINKRETLEKINDEPHHRPRGVHSIQDLISETHQRKQESVKRSEKGEP